jgi:hypothetical protein
MFLNLILEQIENKARGKHVSQPLHRERLPERPAQAFAAACTAFSVASAEARRDAGAFAFRN